MLEAVVLAFQLAGFAAVVAVFVVVVSGKGERK